MNKIVKMYNDHPVRIIQKDGEPWFVAKDVCDVLEINNSRQATSYLDEDERDVITNDTPSGMQEMTIVSEPGLYSLILRSRKPEAKSFKRWVTHEVLPSIRKTGTYVSPNLNIEQLAAVAQRTREIVRRLLTENAMLREKNAFLEQFGPKGEMGEVSDITGKPKCQQRRGGYVSGHGTKPKRLNPDTCGYLQPDLFRDFLPAMLLASTINIFNFNGLLLLPAGRESQLA